MAYLALYRRFRPQGFEGLIGQEQIVKILKNQINTGRVGHAYLFCGARGTGKTTVAKVFAKAINCLNPKDGSPCGECEVCRELSDPSNIDILEMDAASNNGVDDVREMREKIQYPPVVGKYKVYIVDEVHMLSGSAFNALLKTLEEPPSHAVFIFATTEVHKIPQTILSRCMRFDFKLISQPELVGLIKRTFDAIGKEYDEEAVDAIARAGEGSARDSLSIADMCSSYSVGKLTYEDVLEVLGATDKGNVLQLVEAVIDSNVGKALDTVNKIASLGRSMGVLANDMAVTLRDLVVCSTSENANAILCLPESRYQSYQAVAKRTDTHRLMRLVDVFTSLDNAFRYSTHPRIVLETAVVRACRPEKDYDTESLLSRITQLERKLDEVKANGFIPQSSPSAQPSVSAVKVEAKPVEEKPQPEVKTEIKAEPKPELKPIEEKPQAEVKAEQGTPTYDEAEDMGVLPEFDFFSIPPEEMQVFSGAPVEQKPPKTQENPQDVPPARVWGNILKSLRSNGHAVLYTVCKDVSARTENGVITITVSNDSEYKMFSKETHMKTLTDEARKYGDYTIKVVMGKSEEKDDEFERDIEVIKRTFGEDVVNIINN